MNKLMLQTILLSGMFFFNLASADDNYDKFIQFYRNEVFIPERLGNIKLYKDFDGFHIFKDGEIYDIQNCFCDPLLRKMSDEQLVNFIGRNNPKIIVLTPEDFYQINPEYIVEITEVEIDMLVNQLFGGGGYISVNQMDNGEYILHAKMRLMGGVDEEIKKILKEGVTAVGKPAGVALGGAAAIGGTALTAGSGVLVGLVIACGGQWGASGYAASFLAGAGAAAAPVVIVAGVGYLGYVCFRLLTKPTDAPSVPQKNPNTRTGVDQNGPNTLLANGRDPDFYDEPTIIESTID